MIREYLLYMVRVNKNAAAGFFDSITEEESLDRIDGRFNHIRWLAGHMLRTMESILPHFGIEKTGNENFEQLFAGGSQPLENIDEYPSMAELREKLDSNYDRFLEMLESASDKDLEKNIGENNAKPLWQSITFLCMHDFYHMGQVMYHRRGVGKKWPWS